MDVRCDDNITLLVDFNDSKEDRYLHLGVEGGIRCRLWCL